MADAEVTDQAAELVERVAAIDIAKASGMVCMRLPHPSREGRRTHEVWNVPASTIGILELGDRLVCQGVTRVVMEATGAYWKPFFFLLEARGLDCWLVNAREVKNVPGRPKTDKLDAVWLAKLTERGMLRPSFVPPKPVRQLRDLTRMRTVLIRERSRHKQRVEKILEDAQIKLSSVATDIFGVSGRSMIEALIAGERDPRALAEMARGCMVVKKAALAEALTGQFEDHHAFLCRTLLDSIDFLSGQIDALTVRTTQAVEELPCPDPSGGSRPGAGADLVAKLVTIPGVGVRTAQILLAELGPDMTVFPTADHLVSWAKFAPRTMQSGGKSTSGPTGKGNPWIKGAIGEAALSASRSNTFLGARYKRIVKRRGRKRALVAVGHSLLVVVWHLLNEPETPYTDLGSDYHQHLVDPTRRTRDLVRQLKALGHDVTLTSAA
ncbi:MULTISPECIES: IS110 family transposase [unclassified Streptomyces]|uniref:IS110 family transposase n=1 Tax=unclassified Streptomyces TaxID=2593676 RepID=UPI001163F1E2|nr:MULTISPECIES: IS110 family transposase [unclassified Streptomyces]QDN75872.1 IS110 family transposase [Streptomyces sp. S1A1-7]QDO06373.1 IS110 family transposase [Streptomyces sp. S1D4-23]